MSKSCLTAEQEKVLAAGHGFVQAAGQSGDVILMRSDVILDRFGYSRDELIRQLQPGLDQSDRGEMSNWNLKDFLVQMRARYDSKIK